jgi:hypothetical protein
LQLKTHFLVEQDLLPPLILRSNFIGLVSGKGLKNIDLHKKTYLPAGLPDFYRQNTPK